MTFTRYISPDEDSSRWERFTFREGDIVVSTRSKSGTTWVQMICALLVFNKAKLDVPLGWLSPWLDNVLTPIDEVVDRLEAQKHRRIIKTHTPLDGIALDERATYVVVGRHPLDMAISLYHQGNNIDRALVRRLQGLPERDRPEIPPPPLHDWLLAWIEDDADHRKKMDGLRGVMWHLSDAWKRSRRPGPKVVMVRYEDLAADLEGQMRALSEALAITVDESHWPAFVKAASFEAMRQDASNAPGGGVLKDPRAFFRRGSPGAFREVLTDSEIERYRRRVTSMAPPELIRWLHRES